MKRLIKKLMVWLAVVSIPILVAVCWLASIWLPAVGGAGECRNERLTSVKSPTGSHTAYLYLRNCGATVGYTTHVTVLRTGEDLADRKGNVFQTMTTADRRIDLIWRDNHMLGVYHEVSSDEISKQESDVGGISINYGRCHNEVVSERASPSGKNRVVVFVRHCGPYHDYTSHIDLWDEDWKLQPGKGRVLQARGALTEEALLLEWKNDERLAIHHHIDPENIIERNERVWGIQIEYSELSE